MPARSSADAARLWQSRWAPSSNSLRYYGGIIETGPMTLLGAVAVCGSCGLFAYDLGELGFKATIQPRVADLLAKVDRLEQAIREELERRGELPRRS